MKIRLVFVALTVLAVVIVVGWLFNRPSKGVVNSGVKVNNETQISKIKKYQGKHLEFEYSGEYELRNLDNKSLESVQLLAGRGKSNVYVITLRDHIGAMDEDSGVKMREVKKNDYQRVSMEWRGVVGRIYQKIEGVEKVGFWLEDGKLLTIALTANSNDPELDQEFKSLIKTLVIKETVGQDVNMDGKVL